MDSKTRIIIIVGCIVTFLIVPAVTMLVLSQLSKNAAQNAANNTSQQPSTNNTVPANRSNDELIAAIINKHPELGDNNGPIFTIMNVAKPAPGWYVVKLRQNDDPEGKNPAKVLLQDTTQKGLQMLLGPGTSFPDDVTQPIGIPGQVSAELNAS